MRKTRKKTEARYIKRAMLWLLLCCILLSLVSPAFGSEVQAEGEEKVLTPTGPAEDRTQGEPLEGEEEKAPQEDFKVVRVGWYESAFHHTDQFGRRSGYGYEYQQRIANYTNWNYEYVEGSWSELYEMLVKGELDLLSDVAYTEERAKLILYSGLAIGAEDYHAFISPDNTQIRPDDYSTFNGKRVGVNKNSIQCQLFKEWASSHDLHPEIVELTVKTPELLAMLEKGEIDVLVTLDTYGNSANVVPVCKVGSADSFFGINKNRPDLKNDLDVAMNRILEDNRSYNQQLEEMYNDANGINHFLSISEKQWVEEHGPIRVGYPENYLPFCGYNRETDSLIGTLYDYLEFAKTCEMNAKLSFETFPFQSVVEALEALKRGEIDCVFPISISTYDGEKRGIIITDPLITTEMYAGVRTADRQGISSEEEIVVAVRGGDPSYESFLMDHFPKWTPRVVESNLEGFQAVAEERVDCLLLSNYRLNRLTSLCEKYKLSNLATGEVMKLSFAVPRQNDILYSILNKVNHLIPSAEVNSSLTNYSFSGDKVTLTEFIRDNFWMVMTIIFVTASLIMILFIRNMRATAMSMKKDQLISVTEKDPQTNLYNQNYFKVYVKELCKNNPLMPMDAIVINIERFHSLNTLYGRDFGDQVLRTLGQEITDYLADSESIACRLEGDYFYLFCNHVEDYEALLKHFQGRINGKYKDEGIRLRMGVMPWQPNTNPEGMFDQALMACNLIRGDYRNRLMIYDSDLRRRDLLNQKLRNDIGKALEEHEIEVYYQPKYDVQSNPPRLSSAEALVRWQHPMLGLVSPGDFVPLFEQSGQICEVDQYVWEEAARQIREWKDRFGITLSMSVNLSRVDLFHADLFDTLERIVEKNQLDRKNLKLEVTESAYTENADYLIRVIEKLREIGYEIEMDDFGSGYSSLNMLSSMPIDVLKMDMKFVQNIENSDTDMRLVKLILDIAKNLKLNVVAEGVETEGQLNLLQAAGCDLVQGYYFSRPLSAKDFEKKILGKALEEEKSKRRKTRTKIRAGKDRDKEKQE